MPARYRGRVGAGRFVRVEWYPAVVKKMTVTVPAMAHEAATVAAARAAAAAIGGRGTGALKRDVGLPKRTSPFLRTYPALWRCHHSQEGWSSPHPCLSPGTQWAVRQGRWASDGLRAAGCHPRETLSRQGWPCVQGSYRYGPGGGLQWLMTGRLKSGSSKRSG
jgi:hypothetical protein